MRGRPVKNNLSKCICRIHKPQDCRMGGDNLELCQAMGDFDVVLKKISSLLFRKLSCVKRST